MSPGARAAAPLLEVRLGPARAWCSARAHGNVGDHVGDDPEVVARNRANLRAAAGVDDPDAWVWLRQVHGRAVHVATGAPQAVPEADAVVTAAPGLALAVVTADCAPLVLASDDAVGVVHAGHRGLAAGVIEAAVAALREIGHGDVRAFLGPCIRAADYEFGPHDIARFVDRFGPRVEGRTRDGRPALDIPAAIRVVCDRVGVVGFDDCGRNTALSDDFFSYRRRADAGRQATIAVLA
ncbi:MAG TPA: polyphenol oxidase family protein [Acidimicrobiia bacterium]|nr:polyphenol oxidase family protein [Acidimicrobiia bacterium]